jgi:hypothetical protein
MAPTCRASRVDGESEAVPKNSVEGRPQGRFPWGRVILEIRAEMMRAAKAQTLD